MPVRSIRRGPREIGVGTKDAAPIWVDSDDNRLKFIPVGSGSSEVAILDARDSVTPATHATSHQNGGADEISVVGLSGLLADAQTPTAHATSHQSGGSDAIKLDDLATPDDNTDLNASSTRHGLLPKLSNVATQFLNGQGAFTAPTAAAAWQLISETALSANATVVATGLVGFTDIRVLVRAVTLANSGVVQLRVSIDNGATYLSTSGDYVEIAGVGTESSRTQLEFYTGNATTAKSGEIQLFGINLTAPKIARSNFFSVDGIHLRYIPTANDVDAIQIFPSNGGNMTGGTIYIFGR